MDVFTLDPQKRDRFLFIVVGLSLLVSVLLIAAMFAVKYYMLGSLDPLEAIIFLVIFGAIQLTTIVRVVLRNRRSWPTYRCVISYQGFIVSSLATPRTRVEAVNIRRITETLDAFKVFLPIGRHVSVSKRIPADDLARLRERLQQLHPIAAGRGLLGVVSDVGFNWGLALASVSFFYVGILSSLPRTVLICALVTLLISLLRIWRQSRNKLLRLATRILMYVDLLFPLLLTVKLLILRLLLR
ncbi:MAG: hypothetical protein ACTHN5_21790 [Phycisphaerae bacterium]